MISKSLSTSERRAALHQTAGKLAEFCQSLYPLLVAHADDWGCLQGDVFTVKHLVDPTSPRSLDAFRTALIALHNVGLITWYQADDPDGGKWVVYIRGFSAHQILKGHDKDGRKRTYPMPPENPSNFETSAQSRPKSPKHALREENLTEENLTEPIQSPAKPGTAEDAERRKEDNGQVAAFIRRFCELYTQHRHGAKYFVKRQQHVPCVRALLAAYGPERLERLALALLKTDDDWVQETDRGIGILSTKASWLDERLASYEAQHGRIRAVS